ncbi:MAG TPA: hypothetical protein VN743_01925 [Blastocatellia bacterium]|nr:hypothetical protein [Blastocatellia bacterium]
MLPVGREINIDKKALVCRRCDWEGAGAELATGLIRITGGDIYLYAYRCPECGSFDVTAKGKLLEFRSRMPLIGHERDPRNEDGDREHGRAMEEPNWT